MYYSAINSEFGPLSAPLNASRSLGHTWEGVLLRTSIDTFAHLLNCKYKDITASQGVGCSETTQGWRQESPKEVNKSS